MSVIDVEQVVDRLAAMLAQYVPPTLAALNAAGGTQLELPHLMPNDVDPDGDIYVAGHPDRPPRWPAIEISVTRDDRRALDLSRASSRLTMPVYVVVWDTDPVWSVLMRRCWRWGAVLEGALIPNADALGDLATVGGYVKDWGADVTPGAREGREPFVSHCVMTLELAGHSATGLIP